MTSISIHELPPMERLAIEQALYNRLGEDLSTKSPDSLRADADEQMVSNYCNTGAKSYDVHVNGLKVGTYSVRIGKGTPQKTLKKMVVDDAAQLEAFVNSDECAEERAEYMALQAQNFAEFLLETYGIIADGCRLVERSMPAQPPKVVGTTLKIDPAKVGEAIRGYLPTTFGGLLGGGDE